MTQQTTRHVRRHRHHRGVGFYLSLVMMTFLCALILLPIIFTFLYSFFPKGEITSFLNQRNNYDSSVWMDVPLSPAVFSLRQYYKILIEEPSYLQLFCNSVMYTAAILVGQGLVILLTAYALSRFEFRGKNFLTVLIMMLMVLPFQVLMVPNYLIATRLGIYDTPLSVILPGVFSAFPVFIMTRSFQDVPNELLEAAKLDGATAWQIFWKIGVPLGYAGIFAALVLNFIEGWNAVEQPLLFLKSQSNWPLSMYMNDIVTDNLGIAMAASLLSLIPAMLVFLYGQTYLELGIQAGGIKA